MSIIIDGTNGISSASISQAALPINGAFVRRVDSKLKDIISIKDFGATGVGTDNATTAFTAASASPTAIDVYVPAGSYNLFTAPTYGNATFIVESGVVWSGDANTPVSAKKTKIFIQELTATPSSTFNGVGKFGNSLYVGDGVNLAGNKKSFPLLPNGVDDTVAVNAYISAHKHLYLGEGVFKISSQIAFYNADIQGLIVSGISAGKTIIQDIRSAPTTPLFMFSGPLNGRSQEATICDFTLQACSTTGVPKTISNLSLATGMAFQSNDGSIAYGAYVHHMSKISSVIISGYTNGICVDDCTQFIFERLWVKTALRAVWIGYNCDNLNFSNCGFGEEGATYNNMIAAVGGYKRLGSGVTGGADDVCFVNTWFMGLGIAVSSPALADYGGDQFFFINSYFERCKQYFVVGDVIGCFAAFIGCSFNLTATNADSALSKIQIGNQVNAVLTFKQCVGGENPIGGWVSYTGTQGKYTFEQCVLASGSGHLLNKNTSANGGVTRVMDFNDPGNGNMASLIMGGPHGVDKIAGSIRYRNVYLPATGSTLTIDPTNTDFLDVNANTNFTITMSAALPADSGLCELTIRIGVGSVNPTITWGSMFAFPIAYVSPPTWVGNYPTSTLKFRKTGNYWVSQGPANSWYGY